MFLRLNRQNVKRGLSLLRRIDFDPPGARGPLLLEVCTTSACNHHCYFCAEHSKIIPLEHRGSRMPDEMLWPLLEDIERLGVEEVRLAGNGEPTVDPRLGRVVDRLDDAGVRVLVITNGTLLDKVPETTLVKLHKLTISINSFDGDNHRAIHAYAGAPQLGKILDTLRGLCALPGLRPRIQINYVMTSDNVHEIDAIVDFVRTHDVFVAIRPVFVGYDELASRKPAAEQLERALSDVDRHTRQDNNPPALARTLAFARTSLSSSAFRFDDRDRLLPCFAGLYTGYIESNGDYRISCYCIGAPLGNLRDGGLAEIWRAPATQAKAYAGCLMHETGVPSYRNCASCLEGEGYSKEIYRVFSRIPFQMRLIRKRHGRYAQKKSPGRPARGSSSPR